MNSIQCAVIATAPLANGSNLEIHANCYGWMLVWRNPEGVGISDHRLHNSEAQARAAANAEWKRMSEAVAAAKVAA